MSTKKLTSIVRRGSMFAAVFAIVAATFAPAASTFADALNPLTDRSLTLSSSSPGWDYKDGSGNSTYAPPNSGANGKQTGNTFAFKVSTDTATDSTLKAMTFQYCTKSAGDCYDPGDNGGPTAAGTSANAVANSDTTEAAHTSNLQVVSSAPSEVASGDFGTYVDAATGNVKAIPSQTLTGNNFMVYSETAGVWAPSDGWVMTTQVAQDGSATPQENQITLVQGDGTTGTGFAAGTPVKVVFFATDSNYIVNPGEGAFFVKINTYSDVDNTDAAAPVTDLHDVIDGGVTVANVMNQSIEIQTKVLETMDFSVGTVDPDTLNDTQLSTAKGSAAVHQPCDRILTSMNPNDPSLAVNTLKMGDQSSEDSLSTTVTYSTHSYWRLSSNSSAGATVYYSGNTLSNTVGDKIRAIGASKAAPAVGAEQFGIALDNTVEATPTITTDPITGKDTTHAYTADYNTEEASTKVYENGADTSAAGLVDLRAGTSGATGIDASVATDVGSNPSYHAPQLYPLKAAANYSDGLGTNNTNYDGSGSDPIDTNYAFDETSQTIPVPLASESAQVVDCVTGKMRYIANIAATTPAGIYTTKVNYIAAPQY